MFQSSEEVELINEVANDPDVLAYQDMTRIEVNQHSWFRRIILDPIIKPLLAKLFREYLEIAVRAAVKALIMKGKL